MDPPLHSDAIHNQKRWTDAISIFDLEIMKALKPSYRCR
jgi:hypothetical protein